MLIGWRKCGYGETKASEKERAQTPPPRSSSERVRTAPSYSHIPTFSHPMHSVISIHGGGRHPRVVALFGEYVEYIDKKEQPPPKAPWGPRLAFFASKLGSPEISKLSSAASCSMREEGVHGCIGVGDDATKTGVIPWVSVPAVERLLYSSP